MENNNIERVLAEISNDIMGCLNDGFSKVVIYGTRENYERLIKSMTINNLHFDASLGKIKYSSKKPGSQNKVYAIDIDNALKLKDMQDISIHRKYRSEYDIRTRK